MVVVPTENEVVLEFEDTWAESGGKILTLGGVATLIVGGYVLRRRGLEPLSDEGETTAS